MQITPHRSPFTRRNSAGAASTLGERSSRKRSLNVLIQGRPHRSAFRCGSSIKRLLASSETTNCGSPVAQGMSKDGSPLVVRGLHQETPRVFRVRDFSSEPWNSGEMSNDNPPPVSRGLNQETPRVLGDRARKRIPGVLERHPKTDLPLAVRGLFMRFLAPSEAQTAVWTSGVWRAVPRHLSPAVARPRLPCPTGETPHGWGT